VNILSNRRAFSVKLKWSAASEYFKKRQAKTIDSDINLSLKCGEFKKKLYRITHVPIMALRSLVASEA
jgi:hypothetical protein